MWVKLSMSKVQYKCDFCGAFVWNSSSLENPLLQNLCSGKAVPMKQFTVAVSIRCFVGTAFAT